MILMIWGLWKGGIPVFSSVFIFFTWKNSNGHAIFHLRFVMVRLFEFQKCRGKNSVMSFRVMGWIVKLMLFLCWWWMHYLLLITTTSSYWNFKLIYSDWTYTPDSGLFRQNDWEGLNWNQLINRKLTNTIILCMPYLCKINKRTPFTTISKFTIEIRQQLLAQPQLESKQWLPERACSLLTFLADCVILPVSLWNNTFTF